MNAQTTPGVLQGHHRNCACNFCNGTERNRVIRELQHFAGIGHTVGPAALDYINTLERELESLGVAVPRMKVAQL